MGAGGRRTCIHPRVIVTVEGSTGMFTMEQQGKQILFSCSAGLLTVRVPLFFPHRAVGVNVEIQTTCCMKQLRHYACCRPDAPAPPRLREVRVQAADGDLAVEQNSTSGTRFVDTFFFFS